MLFSSIQDSNLIKDLRRSFFSLYGHPYGCPITKREEKGRFEGKNIEERFIFNYFKKY